MSDGLRKQLAWMNTKLDDLDTDTMGGRERIGFLDAGYASPSPARVAWFELLANAGSAAT